MGVEYSHQVNPRPAAEDPGSVSDDDHDDLTHFDFYFYFTVSVMLATIRRGTTIFEVLNERCDPKYSGLDEPNPRIRLFQPLGNSIPWNSEWSVVPDYTTTIHQNECIFEQDLGVECGAQLRKRDFIGFKFISPLMLITDTQKIKREIAALFNTLEIEQDSQLVVLFTSTSFVHIHIKAFLSSDVEPAAKFCAMYMLIENAISGIMPVPVREDKDLIRSMWNACVHAHEWPEREQARSLVQLFRGLPDMFSVATLFNIGETQEENERYAYGSSYPTEYERVESRVYHHIKGLKTILKPGTGGKVVSKYYKVNLGYAFYTLGSVEFREMGFQHLQPDEDDEESSDDRLFQWLDFCARLVAIAEHVTWRQLELVAEIKDLCAGRFVSRDLLWLAIAGLLGGDPEVDELWTQERYDANLKSCQYWYRLAAKAQEKGQRTLEDNILSGNMDLNTAEDMGQLNGDIKKIEQAMSAGKSATLNLLATNLRRQLQVYEA